MAWDIPWVAAEVCNPPNDFPDECRCRVHINSDEDRCRVHIHRQLDRMGLLYPNIKMQSFR